MAELVKDRLEAVRADPRQAPDEAAREEGALSLEADLVALEGPVAQLEAVLTFGRPPEMSRLPCVGRLLDTDERQAVQDHPVRLGEPCHRSPNLLQLQFGPGGAALRLDRSEAEVG